MSSSANKTTNRTACVLGAGVIGAGWVSRFLLMGWNVKVYDPDPEAPRKIQEVMNNAKRSLPGLYDHKLPDQGGLTISDTLEDAVTSAEWIVEAVPERLDFKHTIFRQLEVVCDENAIIASSTSGFKPSELQQDSIRPAQIIVAHPFNPVYLVPLVELVGDANTVANAKKVLDSLGMFPLHVRKEIDAHIGDRLLEAVWREGLWLINDGIATTKEIDDTIRYGFGLRWAQMGLFETYRIAGGEAGMAHFIGQFGPCLEWPWTKLMDVPELTDELVDKIASQSDEQSGHHSIRELERIRDDNLVSMMRALKGRNWGAGELLNKVDEALKPAENNHQGLLKTIERVVPVDWTDYNQHMNESRYGQVFSDAADAVLNLVGANEAYVESGKSYFTVDNHIQYIKECVAGDEIYVLSKVLLADGKKLKLQHHIFSTDDELMCTDEQFLLHVDLKTRKSSEPDDEIAEKLSNLFKAHQNT